MKIAFFQNLWEELYGPLLLAEILERRGHRVRFFLPGPGMMAQVRDFEPQVAAFYATTRGHLRCLTTAGWLKKMKNPPLTVMGGPHATFCPQVLEHPALDAVCVGEGDRSFPVFLDGIRQGRPPADVPNFWVKDQGRVIQNEPGPLVENLDDLPIPSRRPLYDHYPFLAETRFRKVSCARGCPLSCGFCSTPAYRKMVAGKGRFLRRRSVGHVMEELLYLDRFLGFSYVDFVDDLFVLDKQWFMEFAEAYARKLRIPYGCQFHAGYADEEIVRGLKESGCTWVMFGVESGNPGNRKNILQKAVTDEQIMECARLLHKYRLPFQTFNILGLPNETMDQALDTVHINQRIKPTYAWCSLATPLPRTRFWDLCIEQTGCTDQDFLGSSPTSWFDDSPLRFDQASHLKNLQKFFSILVNFPSLEPLVRLLVRLPPNPLFRLIHLAWYGRAMRGRAHLSLFRTFRLYLKVRKMY